MNVRRNHCAALSNTFALPSEAEATAAGGAIDLGAGRSPEGAELSLSVPALDETIVPDAATVTLEIEASDSPSFASVSRTLAAKTLTGADNAGVPATDLRCRLPSDCERYVRGVVTLGADTTDASAASATLQLKF